MACAKSPVMSVKRGDEEVAEAVAPESVAALESVGKELGEQVFFGTERNHAVAQIARGQHVEFFPQAGPEEPPSSVTVTTAARSEIWHGCSAASPGNAHAPQSAQAAWRGRCRRRWRRRAEVGGGCASGALGTDSEAPGSSGEGTSKRNKVHRMPEFRVRPYGSSGYSNSVKRGSSTMLWKSLSERACRRFLGFSSMACERLSRQSCVLPVMEYRSASP